MNQKLILITTAGMISCEIVKANDNFLFAKDVEFQGTNLGKLYIDRNSVVAFSDLETEEKTESKLRNRIIQFSEVVKRKSNA